MATLTLRPAADGSAVAWVASSGSDYTCVDEVTANGDTDYVSTISGNAIERFTTDDTAADAIPDSAVINSVTVYWTMKQIGSEYKTVAGLVRLSSTDSIGSYESPGTGYSEFSKNFTTRPGGGSWTKQNIKDMEFGFRTGAGTVMDGTRVTQCYLVVDYTAEHPAPTGFEIDRQTNPTSCSEDPLFSAVFQAAGDSGTATHAQVQVSEVSDFATTVWDSGWVDITDIADNVRSQEISYGGSAVLSSAPPAGKYYARMRFKDAGATNSLWATGDFVVAIRKWPAAMAGYNRRVKLLWDPDHPEIPGGTDGYVQAFPFQTGYRQVVANNGYFNESIQASGGFQIAYFNGKTHIVYLAEYSDNAEADICIVTLDHLTGQWGTPVKIIGSGTSYDTHYFPTLCIDLQGYIHVFFGCHQDPLKYIRSAQPNISGSLPGEPASGNWIRPSDGAYNYQTPNGAIIATYPVAFTIPGSGRIYVFYRSGDMGTGFRWRFNYSDNHGQAWSTSMLAIDDTFNRDGNNQHYRVYVYGIRFDENKKRLHISWTHNHVIGGTPDVERGIWYAYCDFGTDFTDWKWADGTSAGTTNTAPIDFNTSKAIRLAFADGYGTDTLSRIFSETLVLDKFGEPIVFWEQKWKTGAPTNETNLVAAKWSANVGGAGSWTLIYVSDQVNALLRVRRSSVGIMTDRDGLIKCYMPVNSKTYYRLAPTGDVDSVGVTRKSEASNYLEVDDGFTNCDGDGSYFDLAATTGKASFPTTGSFPSNLTILAVEVEAACKWLAAPSSYYKLYLNNGTTDAEGSANLVSDATYQLVTNSWTQNPFTSAAWQASEIGALKFGIKNTGTTSFRVSRIMLKVYYLVASDDEFFSAEIRELTSADNGLTWTSREISRNSGIGVPIMNHKHHLTNDTIEMVWCSGNDIFYYADKPFGLAQRSGIDIRMFYGDTEIHRIIDYANMAASMIYFKVQETIAANRTAGPKDYFLYLGNPNEATQPLSDPNQVFKFFENWETFARNANPNGVRGWSVSGTTAVYSSPPDHANKVWAGEKAVQTVTSAILDQTLGSALQNLYIIASAWLESGNGYLGFRAVDASDVHFAVAVNTSTNKAAYSLNGTWADDPVIKGASNHYWRMAIQVTANGCSAWFMGRLLCREKTAITSVDKLQLVSPGNAFFDYIWVMYRLEKAVGIVTGSPGPTPYMGYNTDHGVTWQDGYDAKIVTVNSRIIKLAVKITAQNGLETGTASFHIRICNGTTYNPDAIEASATGTVVVTATTGSFSTTLTFSDLAQGQKTIKVDYYSWTGSSPSDTTIYVDDVTEYNMTKEPAIVLQAAEIRGFTFDASLIGPRTFLFTFGMSVTAWALNQALGIAVESLATPSITARMPVDELAGFALNQALGIESGISVRVAGSAPIDLLALLSITKQFHFEWSGWLQHVASLAVEIGLGIHAAAGIPVEILQSLTLESSVVIGYLGSLSLSKGSPVEGLVRIVVDYQIPIDDLQELRQAGVTPMEVLTKINQSRQIVIEALGSRELSAAMQVEFQQTVAVDSRIQVELLRLLSISGKLPIGIIGSLSCEKASPIDYLAVKFMQAALPIEQQVRFIDSNRVFPIEQLQSLASIAVIPVAWNGQLEVAPFGKMPIEWTGTVQFDKPFGMEFLQSETIDGGKVPISFKGSLSVASAINAGWLQSVGIDAALSIEGRQTLVHDISTMIESLCMRRIDGVAPISLLASIGHAPAIPVESQGAAEYTFSGVIPLEWTVSFANSGQMSIEALPLLIHHARSPIAIQATREFIARLSAEFLGSFMKDAPVPTETASSLLVTFRHEIEALLKTDHVARLPVESAGGLVFETYARLPICWMQSLAADAVMPTDCKQSVTIVHGNVMVESLVRGGGTAAVPTEHQQIVASAARVISEIIGTLDAVGHISVDHKGSFDTTMGISIEFGNGCIMTGPAFPIEHLRVLLSTGRVPIDARGITILGLFIANAALRMPFLGDVQLSTAELREIALRVGLVDAAQMSPATLRDILISVAQLRPRGEA